MKTQNLLCLVALSFFAAQFDVFSTPPTYRVYGTREGLVGNKTANGHIITSRDHFVALPSSSALNSLGGRTYTVTIRNPANGRVAYNVPVWDIGPWNTTDNYWHWPRNKWTNLYRGLPEAQAAYQSGYNGGKDGSGRSVANPAGIDIADGTFWDDLGMVNNGWVEVTYNWETAQVFGAIASRYYGALGGEPGVLGAPTIAESTCPDGVGKFNHFANGGSIYWTPSTGAWDVRGAIRTRWSAMGWEKSPLGYPTTGESAAANGGRFNHFQNGSIYWTSALGAHDVRGAIRDKWASLGWETGFLGFPTTDESPCAVADGRYNHFQGGSIYWSSASGAWSVQGAIRDKWASMGWENSCLGYPTSDEYDWNGTRRNDFQNGYIYWTPSSGAVAACNGAPPPPPPPPPAIDISLDNSASGFTVTGTWSTGSTATDKFGTDYRYHSTAAVSEPAQWQVTLTNTGNYLVSAWWPQGSNRSATAPYVVYHSAGSTTVNANQQANGGKWNPLGTFSLNAGANTIKLSTWTATGFIVVADAIRWQQQ